jgi:hypothetical protein
MDFRDVPNLLKFQEHARSKPDCEITMDAYRRIREILQPAPKPPDMMGFDPGSSMENLRASCEAVEKATRVVWACAVSTNQVNPPIWDYTPDYTASIEYFVNLNPLELMALTTKHRIQWEETLRKQI